MAPKHPATMQHLACPRCLAFGADMRAMFWDSLPDKAVQCTCCPHACRIPKGGKGRCRVRVNMDGTLTSLVHHLVSSAHLDPVEKKPLYHFLPGSKTFSVGSAGCNFSCRFCQNYNISQVPESGLVPGKQVRVDAILRAAVDARARSVAFTYNEPVVFFEQVYETAGAAVAEGLRCILVSNGFMSADCLGALSKRIHAANIDLKSFRDDFYRQYCGGRLQPVLDTLKGIKKLGWWLEVTTLIIPGCNDSDAELKDLAVFVRDELGPDTPWHLSAFHGAYRMARHPSTPVATIEKARRIGLDAGLRYVYMGNVTSIIGGSTFCPSCSALVVERRGYEIHMADAAGRCAACGLSLPGVWR